MPVAIGNFDLRLFNMQTRMPFRYGIVTATALPHLFVAADCEVDGRRVGGIAADHLPPKWFTKNPTQPFEQELAEMFDVIRAACGHAIAAGPCDSPFDLWCATYAAQKQWAARTGYPPLLWAFGISLVERAMIDGFCRGRGIAFSKALRENLLGINLRRYFSEFVGRPDLGCDWNAGFLPARPLDSIIARHTVGLIDPLTDAEITPADRLNDGLPQALDHCIRFYGLKHFKIKLAGDVEKDLRRLRDLAGLIETACGGDYAFTLDGNENYREIGPFRMLWEELSKNPALDRFLQRLIFIEQPLHRDVALSDGVRREMLNWASRPPLIIDESDGSPGSLLQALECGYIGTSHKNCKGVFKSIANARLLADLRQKNPNGRYILSGEDLSNVGPVALLEDLAVAANLGIESVERNGHHYFRGISMHDAELQKQVLAAHGDLFTARPFAAVDVRQGRISTQSVCRNALGVGFEIDLDRFTPLEDWRFESLGLA
jgi:hypothetical protein